VSGPFEVNITRAQLLSGFVSTNVPNDCVTIRVTSLSVECPVSLDITLTVITTTTTSSTTTSTTTSAPFGIGRCVPLYVNPTGYNGTNSTFYAYDFINNTSTEINLGYAWKSKMLAHTGNKLWIYDNINNHLIQFDITLSPFSYGAINIIDLSSVLLYGPLDEGLTAVSDTKLLGTAPVSINTVSGNAIVYAVVEITLDPLNINSPTLDYTSLLLGYTTNAIGTVFPRTIVGDMILTTNNKLIFLTTGADPVSPGIAPNKYYITQYAYTGLTGNVPEYDGEISVPECVGIFQNGTDIYLATRTGEIYLLDKVTAGLTYVKSLSPLVNINIIGSMSQIPSCVTENLIKASPPIPPPLASYTYIMYDCDGNFYTLYGRVDRPEVTIGSYLYKDQNLSILADDGFYGFVPENTEYKFYTYKGEILYSEPCVNAFL